MSEPMLGQIMLFGGNYNPERWGLCAGGIIDIAENEALFSILGNTYGGDGRSTFGLPDLRGRTPLGMGSGPGRLPRILGQVGGYERVPLAISQMPEHSHLATAQIGGQVTATANCYTGTQSIVSTPDSAVPAQQGLSVPNDSKAYSRSAPNATMSSEYISTATHLQAAVDIGETGGEDSHENMPPWICMNYIVALDGYYPPRS